jgi:ABC-type glycerol-3-phosphate transport system substrate-binding protein
MSHARIHLINPNGGSMITLSVSRRGLLGTSVLATAGLLVAPPRAWAQKEIVYSTFLDPANAKDPRAAAQTRMIAAFEKVNPDLHIKLLVDPTVQVVARALKSHDTTPDVVRMPGFSVPEIAASGGMQSLDALIARDKLPTGDWLLPLDGDRVDGHLYSLPQDYRIPILMYRKSLLAQAHVTPPRTWDEVCADGPKFPQQGIIPFAIPVGAAGGLGGAQAFGEFYLSSMIPSTNGDYFNADGSIAFSRASFLRAATTIKDLFTTCKATPQQSLQFGFNEVHDGLRAGKIAMGVFGLYRYRTIQEQGAGDDLAWAPPPGYTPTDRETVYGYHIALNAFSTNKEDAWRFLKFMISPEAEAIAAEGGEVVSRASAYSAPYFQTSQAADQKQWAQLIRERGREVRYTAILTTFHQIVGDATQRMILTNGTPEAAYDEVLKNYNAALESSK